MKFLKETLFYNYILYLIGKLRIYCFFEVLEPLSIDSLKTEKVSILKFRESFNNFMSDNNLRWSGFIYLVGSNDIREFCITLQQLIKLTPNLVFYHIYLNQTRMIVGDFLNLFANKFNVYLRILTLLTFWRIVFCFYTVLLRKLTGLVLLKGCQQ